MHPKVSGGRVWVRLMTTTTDRLTRPDTEVSELRDRDRSAVLDLAVSSRLSADREEARLLAAAVHWVDLTTTSRWRATARRASRRTPSRSWPPRWICPTQPVWRWSARRSSSASGCRGCGRSCRTAGSRPGRPGRWRRRRRPSHASRWRSSTGTWPSPDPHNRLPAPGPAIHEARLQLRSRPGPRRRAERAGPPRRVVRPPGVDGDHDHDGPGGHAGRTRPRWHGLGPRLDHRPPRRHEPVGRPPGDGPGDAGPPATCPRHRP